VEFTPSIILLYPPSPIPGIVSIGLIFPFSYMCTQNLHHIYPPKGERNQIWWKYYVLMYENGTMSPLETMLPRGEEG
jgi:hypothetical protein